MVVTGIYYAFAAWALGGLLWQSAGWWAAMPFILLGCFCLWFFRDPDRRIPPGPVAVSPADGKIVLVRRKPDWTQVCIFMNVLDVHVNRAPIAGKIVGVEYHEGKFMVASKDAASMENERNIVSIDGDRTMIRFTQIAGLIARRIVCFKKPGDYVTAGERVGLIKFGSRVDVDFGPEWEVTVEEGQRVAAGASILARRRNQ